jgi:hypothetical protein
MDQSTRHVAARVLLAALPALPLAGVAPHAAAGAQQSPLPVQSDDFQLRCYVTDPATGQPISSLIPGDIARASAAIKVGETVMAGKASIAATAAVSLYGYDLKLKLGQTVLEIPPLGQRDELLELYTTAPSTWPASYGQRFVTDFTVPNTWPRSQVTVKVVATFEGIGSRSCSKTLDIQ